MATQIRLSQLTGSLGTGSGQINDATTLAAGADIGAGDLSTVLSHMASAIQRIHGDATFSENPAGEFSQTLTPITDAASNLGSTVKEWGQVHANNLISQAALAVSASNANITVKGLALDVDADSTLSLDGAGGINIGTAANVAVDFNSSTFDLDASGALTLDSATSISIGTAADVAFDVDSAAFDLDASGAVTVDTSGAASHIALTSAHTAGDAIVISANAAAGSILNVDAGIMDVDVQGAYTLDASGVSIDSDAASNVSTSAGALTLTSAAAATWSTSAGALVIDGAGGLTLDSDGTDAVNLGTEGVAKTITIGADESTKVDINALAIELDAAASVVVDAVTTMDLDSAGIMSLNSSAAAINIGNDDVDAAINIGTAGEREVTVGNTDGAAGLTLVAGTGGIDVDSDNAITLDTTAGGISLDAAAGAVNVTAAAAALTLAGTSLDVDASAGAVAIDASAGIAIGGTAGTSLDLSKSGVMTTVKGTLNVDEAATFDSNVAIAGNLDVNGTTTTIDTANMSIQDSIIALGVSGSDGGYSLTGDRGILFTRGADTAAQSGLFYNGTRYQLGVSVTGPTSSSFGSVSSYDDLLLSKVEFDSANNHVAMNGSVFTVTGNAAVEVVAGGSSDIILDAGGDVVIDGTSQKLEFGSAGSGEHITSNGTDLTLASGADIDLTATADINIPANVGLTFGDDGEKIEGNGTGLTIAGGSLNLDSEGDITLDAGGGDIIFKDGSTESGRFNVSEGATSIELIAVGDIVLDPGGNNVVPGSDSADSLGSPASDASHSEGSQTLSTSGLTSSQTISMSASGNHAVLFGSSLSAPSAGSAPSGLATAVGSSVSLSSFSSTYNGTLTISNSYSGSTISAGTILSLNGSSSSFYFVVTSDYSSSSGSSMSICAMPNVSGHSTSIGSVSSISSYTSSGFSGSGALSGVSVSAGQTVSFTVSGDSAVFVSVVGPSSSTPWGFVGDPRNDVSDASSFSTSGVSAAKAGGTITSAALAVAWANLYVDAIDLNGQGSISMGGTGRIDLDADDDTSIRASADDVITFEAGGVDSVAVKATGLHIVDDLALFFGSGDDAKIEYDEDGTDQLRIHQPAAGVVIAGTNPKLVLGDAGAEDTMMVFDGNAADFRIGLDDGTDKLEIGAGSAHGTTIALGMDASGHVTQIGQSTHTTGLYLQWDGSKAVFATVAPTIYRKTITATEIAESDGTQGYTFENADTPSGSSATSFGGSSYTYDGKIQVYLNGQLQLLGGTSDSSGIDCKPSQTTAKRIDFLSAGDLALDDVLQVIVYA